MVLGYNILIKKNQHIEKIYWKKKNQQISVILQRGNEMERESCVFIEEWQLINLEEMIELEKSLFGSQQYNKLFT